MKPFNFVSAQAGCEVVDSDGEPVRILCFDRDGPCCIVAIKSNREVETYTRLGALLPGSAPALFMASTKKTGWINIYSNGSIGSWHDSKAEAKSTAIYDVIDTIEIEWEE